MAVAEHVGIRGRGELGEEAAECLLRIRSEISLFFEIVTIAVFTVAPPVRLVLEADVCKMFANWLWRCSEGRDVRVPLERLSRYMYRNWR